MLSSAIKRWGIYDNFQGIYDKLENIRLDFASMFLDLNDLENDPQFPGYPGYQLFVTLLAYI